MRDWSFKGPRSLIFALTALLGVSSTACPAVDRGESDSQPGDSTTPSESTSSDNDARKIVNKVDLVLAIDNSRTRADKQQTRAIAVPDLVASLVTPPCVYPDTGKPASTPKGPLQKCPAGTEREYAPLLDIHIGIVSS